MCFPWLSVLLSCCPYVDCHLLAVSTSRRTAHALSNQHMQPWLDGVISACYNTQPFTECSGVLYSLWFYWFGQVWKVLVSGRNNCQILWIKVAKAVWERCRGFKVVRAWQRWKHRVGFFFSVYQGRVIVKLRTADSHYMQVWVTRRHFDSTVEKSEVESLVTPLRDFQNKISDSG